MGLDQGRFRLSPGSPGTRRAWNGRANSKLLEDVPPEILEARGLWRNAQGPLRLQSLVEVLRALVPEDRR